MPVTARKSQTAAARKVTQTAESFDFDELIRAYGTVCKRFFPSWHTRTRAGDNRGSTQCRTSASDKKSKGKGKSKNGVVGSIG